MTNIRLVRRVKCARCGKTESANNAKLWNAVFDKGVLTHYLCPDCQTQEEFLEAEVNEALTDYSKARAISSFDELIGSFRPHWHEALEIIARGETERGNEQLRVYLERFRVAFNSMYRNHKDVQLTDIGEAFALLQEVGEFPALA